MNFWVVYDNVDPGNMIGWLVSELARAEQDGVKVFIISHIPLGNGDCVADWSHQYNLVIRRFSHVIAGAFYAHTHKDHFQIFFDEQGQPINMGYVAQSQTTYKNLNSGYKVYHVDGVRDNATFEVMETENWIIHQQKANQNSTPE